MKYMKYNYTNAYLSVKGNRVKNSMSTIIKKKINKKEHFKNAAVLNTEFITGLIFCKITYKKLIY